ncbi:MAG: DUF4202 domain-containing protein [Rhizobiales bacterium]|nr:DUF4202 domain-containing protein [Hyphomicrobiales bacterium]
MKQEGRLAEIENCIDAANAADPNKIEFEGTLRPAALIYGKRMSAMLKSFRPEASELLQLAARAQHIERWKSPRTNYPEGRGGYLLWRKELKEFHAERLGALMVEAAYTAEEIDRAGALIRKERLKRDHEVQALEDVVCLVFLKHYAGEFIAKHEDEKVIRILAKTSKKMSPEGLEAAGRLKLPDRLSSLLQAALERP